MKSGYWIALAVAGVFVLVGLLEWSMGRSALGPDGQFGWWESNIWSAECSQRVADAYAFSHIGHGIIFFGFLWLVARRLSVGQRYLIAVLIEAAWEILENSPIIINRYREATAAQGYEGDSILNSLSDLMMMSLGFLFAWRTPVWASVALLVVMEIGCAWWGRDNLTLNVIMLIHPIDAIREWQLGAEL